VGHGSEKFQVPHLDAMFWLTEPSTQSLSPLGGPTIGLLLPERRTEVDELVDSLNSDPDETDEVAARRAAAVG
jgi:hypothetical protein